MILSLDESSFATAAERLRAGGLVAFPTETVYGLGARADQDDAVARIYAAKGRPASNPTIVHTATAEEAFALCEEVPAAAIALARAFWPGPLTLVMRVRAGAVSRVATAGGDTVALRVPAHPVARRLLESVRLPIAAPSANRSTAISPTRAEHVHKSLGAQVLVLDGGPTGFGIESTIVSVLSAPAVILRRGSLTEQALAAITPVVDRGSRVESEQTLMTAPGGMAKHYAPSVPVRLVPRDALHGDPEVGFLVRRGTLPPAEARAVEVLEDDPIAYARELYAALHRLEDSGARAIVIEALPEGAPWAAVRDRVARAASD